VRTLIQLFQEVLLFQTSKNCGICLTNDHEFGSKGGSTGIQSWNWACFKTPAISIKIMYDKNFRLAYIILFIPVLILMFKT
jgi:hypothetical protein